MTIVKADDGQKRIALAYLATKLKLAEVVGQHEPFELFLVCKGADARGAVLYKNWSSGDIEMLCAGEPGWVTPAVLKFVFDFPFNYLDCNRVTCIAHRKNKEMRGYLERMGFRLEGVKRKAIHGGDACIYGLLKGEAQKWL